MSSKTLAREGASLINRLFIANPLRQRNGSLLLPRVPSSTLLDPFVTGLQTASQPQEGVHSDLSSIRFFNGLRLTTSMNPSMLKLQSAQLPTLQEMVAKDAEPQKRVSSPEELRFPCGLPSLRFFIEDDAMSNEPLALSKRTYQPSTIRRKRNHGYLARKATVGGRRVIARRLAKGRSRISV